MKTPIRGFEMISELSDFLNLKGRVIKNININISGRTDEAVEVTTTEYLSREDAHKLLETIKKYNLTKNYEEYKFDSKLFEEGFVVKGSDLIDLYEKRKKHTDYL